MSRGERTYVSTAFVPFTRRRVDAVADLLVDGLRANDFHAERLRIPADIRSHQARAAAAAAAALVDVTWAHRMIELEFPCLQLLHGRAAAWRVRGGLAFDVLSVDAGGLGLRHADMASRFDNDWVEPGAVAGTSSRVVDAPPGLVTDALMRRGTLRADGDGVVVVSLAPECDAGAADLASGYGRSLLVPAAPVAGADDDLEARLWRAIGAVDGRDFAQTHVLVPPSADAQFVERATVGAGALEAWSQMSADGGERTLMAPGAGASPDAIHAAWATLAGELVP